MKDLLKPIIVLTIICLVTSALLGFTYEQTKPLIDAAEKQASDEAMAEVVPGSGNFTAITGAQVDALIAETAETKVGLLAAAKDDNGSGYAFKVQDKGFGGAYTVMVGIGMDGKITGAKLMDNSETPGLGSKTGTADFTGQFLGKDKSLEGVETITGATISSKTFLRCIDTAYRAFEAVGEGA